MENKGKRVWVEKKRKRNVWITFFYRKEGYTKSQLETLLHLKEAEGKGRKVGLDTSIYSNRRRVKIRRPGGSTFRQNSHSGRKRRKGSSKRKKKGDPAKVKLTGGEIE